MQLTAKSTGQRPVELHECRKVGALDELHHQKMPPVGFIRIKRRDNVRVNQLGRGFDFAMESL